MRRLSLAMLSMILVSGCSSLSGDKKPEKTEDKTPIVDVKHIDLSCAPSSARDAGPYAEVNRVSIDLVNNRIDLFSKAQIWQFHAVADKKAGKMVDIKIAYAGRDIVAWGMNSAMPFAFYYTPAKSTVAMTYIKAGEANAVTFDCG